jgi:glycosyltransferase involved in cell wall biosynthesis
VRVLLWSDLFWPYIGGPEVLVAKLMPALRRRGHEFCVVTSHDFLELPGEDSYEGIPVHRLPLRAALRDGGLTGIREAQAAVAEVKRAWSGDLVHVVGVGPSAFFHLRTAAAHPAPWAVWLQTQLPVEPDTLLREVVVSADWVAACSEAVLAEAREVAPEIAPRSSVIPNAADLGPEPPDPLPAEPHLLCLGRLVSAKGFDTALTALAMLAGRFPELRLTIAGDGPERPELEAQAAALGLDGRVTFAGWVDPDRVPELLRAAGVVVMPSRREGLPVAAVEAAAMARPIVASRVGGLPELIEHECSGLLVEPEDPRGVADAVAYLLEHPAEAARLGRAARARVRETLSLDRCADAVDELYRTLVRR